VNRKRRGIALTLVNALAFFACLYTQNTSRANTQKTVLAFYYVWYDQTTWSKTPDVPAIKYTSTDKNAIARHVEWAQGAGINGFVVSWYGNDTKQQTQPNFLALLDIAAARGFKAAIHFETRSPFMQTRAKIVEGLRYAVNTLANHPGYLRHNGKPVIFFWQNDRFSPSEWSLIRKQIDPNRNTLWIAEGVTTTWLSEFDGLHMYNVAWSRDFYKSAMKFATPTKQLGKIWIATAMPGWDDRKVKGRAGTYVKNRRDGQMFRESFIGAAASQPDLLVITSFNEWMEGSHIEPSVSFGDIYLNLTRELIAQYRAGALPVPTATPAK
jgi:hypothetical protein